MKSIEGKYEKKENTIKALGKIDLEVNKGDLIAIMGPSSSRKTTLLNILGCLDLADSGDYILDDFFAFLSSFPRRSCVGSRRCFVPILNLYLP